MRPTPQSTNLRDGESMGSDGPEQADDLEIEVSALHRPVPATTTAEFAEATSRFAALWSLQTRRRRGIIVSGLLLLVVVALALTITPTRQALVGTVFGPTPTATAPVRAGEDNLYVEISPLWGAVTLDGKRLAHLPAEGVDQPLHLARGVHTLRWRIAPIIDLACRLTVPLVAGDTCPMRVGIVPGKKGVARVVTLQLSLANVAPSYREALLAEINAALDAHQSSETVRVGESYLGVTLHGLDAVVATQPLLATLRFVSDAENPQAQCPAINSGPGANCTMNGDCREICTAPWQTTPTAPGRPWPAYILAHASWSYRTADGRVLVDNQPDIGGELQFLGYDEYPVPITIGWDGSVWKVSAGIGLRGSSAPLPDPICASSWAEVQFNFVSPPTSLGWQSVSLAYLAGATAADGCVLAMTAKGQETVLLLHRFGVLLAANTAAQRSLGQRLPMADAYEQAFAQQLAGSVAVTTGASNNG